MESKTSRSFLDEYIIVIPRKWNSDTLIFCVRCERYTILSEYNRLALQKNLNYNISFYTKVSQNSIDSPVYYLTCNHCKYYTASFINTNGQILSDLRKISEYQANSLKRPVPLTVQEKITNIRFF